MNPGDGAKTEPVLASACLLGVRCRYDGTSRESPELLARLPHGRGVSRAVIPVCPEQLGGLPTPRSPCRLQWSDTAEEIATEVTEGPEPLPFPSVPSVSSVTSVAKPFSATGEDVLAGRALVVDDLGVDRTASFLRGAEETLRIARSLGAGRAFLKAGSPSCDARFGVTAARLRRAGVDVVGVR